MIGAAANRSAAVGMYWGTGVSGFIFIRERRQIAVIQQKRSRWKKQGTIQICTIDEQLYGTHNSIGGIPLGRSKTTGKK